MKSLDDGTVDVVLKSHEFQATGFVKLPKLQSAGSGHDYAEVRCSGGISVPLAWEFIDVCIWDEGWARGITAKYDRFMKALLLTHVGSTAVCKMHCLSLKSFETTGWFVRPTWHKRWYQLVSSWGTSTLWAISSGLSDSGLWVERCCFSRWLVVLFVSLLHGEGFICMQQWPSCLSILQFPQHFWSLSDALPSCWKGLEYHSRY